jgi:hypothetical protein
MRLKCPSLVSQSIEGAMCGSEGGGVASNTLESQLLSVLVISLSIRLFWYVESILVQLIWTRL